jgi:tetratricopeptide (TPR) repeat protein
MDRQTRQAMKHDKFLDELNRAYSLAHDHRRKLIFVAVALVLLAVAATLLAGYGKLQEREAQALLSEGIELIDTPAGVEIPGRAEAYETEEAKLEAAEAVFRRVVDEYGRRDAAAVANLYLARMESDRGDLESARPRLERFIRKYPKHVLSAGAELSLLHLRLAEGEIDAVIAEAQQALDGDPRLPKPTLLALLAQAYEMKGENDNALQIYRRIANEYPDSPYSLDAQRKLVQG